MKILQVCPRYFPYIGGIETHVQLLSEEIVRRGFEVTVVSIGASKKLSTNEIINGVNVIRTSGIAPAESYYFSLNINEIIKKVDYDVIHLHSYHSLLSYQVIHTPINSKVLVFTPHFMGFPSKFPRNILHRLYKPFGGSIFDVATKIITLTHYEKKILEEAFTIPSSKIINIPEHIYFDQSKFQPKSDLRTIGFVGRLSEEKNTQQLLFAFSNLRLAEKKFRLIIIGDGPQMKKLQKTATKLGLGNSVRFLGKQSPSNVHDWLKKIDILVLPSQYEVMGLAVLEAMACGIPVVITPVGELSNILRHGKTCLFTKIGDPTDLSKKLLTLINNNQLANSIAKNGYLLVREKFEIKNIIAKYISLYSEIGGRK